MQAIGDQLQRREGDADRKDKCREPLVVLARLADQMAEARQEDEEAADDDRVGDGGAREDLGARPGQEVRQRHALRGSRRLGGTDEVERGRKQEHDDGGQPEGARPACDVWPTPERDARLNRPYHANAPRVAALPW